MVFLIMLGLLFGSSACSVSQGGVSSLRQLGYCPQFDALNPKLTAREQLTFYARLRAIPDDRVDEVCELFVVDLVSWLVLYLTSVFLLFPI